MTEKGRAVLFYGVGKPFQITEYPVLDPEPGAIMVKVSLANICGTDLHWWRGDTDLAALGARGPRILGHESTGTVARLGEGVVTDSAGQPLKVGDMVVYRYFYPCGHCRSCLKGDDAACPFIIANMSVLSCERFPHFIGAFAEYYYLRPGHVVFKVPDGVTAQMVAPVNCCLSQVIYGLQKVGFSFGETIVIQGAGGLGINAAAVAKDMGADKVIVIDGITERLELAKAFGADELIDFREYKTPEERVQRVKDLTGGWGADVVAELVGSTEVVPEGLNMLGFGGRYLEIGNANLGKTYVADPGMLVFSNKKIFNVSTYTPGTLKKALDFISRAKGRYPFDKLLSRSYPLEDINQAFEDQNKGLVSRSAIVP